MYKCENCSKIVPPSVPATRIILKTKNKKYPERKKVHKFHQSGRKHERNDPGGVGSEVVREMTVCPQCAEAMDATGA